MDWHVTWQDPVALALVVLALLGARWLRRRLTPVGCSACAHTRDDDAATPEARAPRTPSAPTRVPLERLRLGRPR